MRKINYWVLGILILVLLFFLVEVLGVGAAPFLITTDPSPPLATGFTNQDITTTFTVTNTTSSAKTFEITPYFSSPVTDFQTSDHCDGVSVPPSSSCSYSVTLNSSIAGDKYFYFDLVESGSEYVTQGNWDITLSPGGAAITGSVDTNLPPVISVHGTYPVVFSFTNNGGQTATGLNASVATNPLPGLFTPSTNTCTDSLAAGASCSITGNFATKDPGSTTDKETITATLNYIAKPGDTDQTTATAETFAQIIQVNVTGATTTRLPETSSVNHAYPVTFTFTNNTALSATQVGYIINNPAPNSFVVDTAQTTCPENQGELAANKPCTIIGTYTPLVAGEQALTVQLTYLEGAGTSAKASTSTTAVQAVVTGELTTPLESKTSVGQPHPVIFSFSNTSTVDATNVGYNMTSPVNSDFVVDEASTTCPKMNGILAANNTCTVSGNLTPSTAGEEIVAVSLSYAENSATVDLSSPTTAELESLTASVTTPLPTYTSSGQTYPVVFTLKNDTDVDATGVAYSTNFPPDFTLESTADSCPSTAGTLAAHASCIVSGNLVPLANGNETVAVSFNYLQVTLEKSTETTVDPTLLVAVGAEVSLARSTDSYFWTKAAPPADLDSATILESVAWSESLHLFVAVGNHGVILTSADGKSWTQQAKNLVDVSLMAVVWSPEQNQFVAVGGAKSEEVDAQVLTSSDGTSWTPHSSALSRTTLLDLAWDSKNSQYVAVGSSGVIATSSDGQTWVQQETGTTVVIPGIAINPASNSALYIASTQTGDDTTQGLVFTSPSGTTWSPVTTTTSGGFWQGVAFNTEGQCLIAGDEGRIMSSPDGIHWTTKTIADSSLQLNKVVWDEGTQAFIIIGDQGSVLTSSDAGNTWKNQTSELTAALHGITEGISTSQTRKAKTIQHAFKKPYPQKIQQSWVKDFKKWINLHFMNDNIPRDKKAAVQKGVHDTA